MGEYLWQSPPAVNCPKKRDANTIEVQRQIYAKCCRTIKKKWRCDVSDALPKDCHHATPYSLVLVIKLSQLAACTSDFNDGRLEAHNVLEQEWRERISSLPQGDRQFVTTTVWPQVIQDERVIVVEHEVHENIYGVMLADVVEATFVIWKRKMEQSEDLMSAIVKRMGVKDWEAAKKRKYAMVTGSWEAASKNEKIRVGLQQMETQLPENEHNEPIKADKRVLRSDAEHEQTMKMYRKFLDEQEYREKAYMVKKQQQQPQKKKKQLETPGWLKMEKAEREEIVEATMVKFTDSEEVKQRVAEGMGPPRASEVARAKRIEGLINGTREPMFSSSAIVTRVNLRAPKKVKGGGGRNRTKKDNGSTVAEALASLGDGWPTTSAW
ncbi:hypothetical protein LTR56_005443 [Elasticomyces elasticus]|nr:hypothetical protein LTR22_015261 [Elasticomyces elasticus]KAK3651934.1 hypothetical protein LTR56_005443 [Elasticomyces elasticus]KAK4927829.1 hypothetical protein LTR49_005455 [Elasticomyces elasticus]KAK5750897.1 hypothetical protein LTS12_019040 [Elasticomyces elasticus]